MVRILDFSISPYYEMVAINTAVIMIPPYVRPTLVLIVNLDKAAMTKEQMIKSYNTTILV